MPARLRDVAEAAGVSVTTVAHVLRGYTKSRIKQETIDHVVAVAAEIGYRPNAIARSLKTQQVKAIGLYTGYGYHSLRDPFLAEVYTGIRLACRELHYDFVVHGDIEGKTAQEIKLKLSDGKVGGLVVHAPTDDPVVACLVDGDLPSVAIADRQPSFPSLVADDEQGMQLLVEYLWERGHRKMLYGTSHLPLMSIEARSRTFVRLITERGGEAIVRPIPSHNAAQLVDDVLAMPDRPTAICCWNDFYAYLLVGRCLKTGIRIPDDLAIVGFDGLLDTRLPARNLVTAAVPWEHMASEAVRMLVRQIGGETLPGVTVFPVGLIEGDTA